jgi:hypothetical protein
MWVIIHPTRTNAGNEHVDVGSGAGKKAGGME